MHKLVTLIAAAALLAVCLAPAAPQPSAQATADVNLTIEQYASLNILNEEIVMNPVPAAWIGDGQPHTTCGTSNVDVLVNFLARVRCLKHIPLHHVPEDGIQTITALLMLQSNNVTYWENGDYHGVDLDPGEYISPFEGLTLTVTIQDKTWTFEDEAGTYEGEVTLEIYPKP